MTPMDSWSFIPRAVLAVLVGVASPMQGHQGRKPREPEYSIKARILHSIGGYITWPATQKGANRPFVIGVLGESPFEHFLDEMGRGKVIQNRPASVTYIRSLNPSAIQGCDILFICESEMDRLADILRVCRGKSILTVSDSQGFAEKGVMINFVVTGVDYIGFEVNKRAAKGVGLEISSAILASPRTRIIEEGP